MIVIQRNIHIRRPLEMVFNFVSNFRYDEQWRAGVIAIDQQPAAAPRVGTRINETLEIVGGINHLRAEIMTYEPNRKIGFQCIEADLPMRGFRLVEATSIGARFTYQVEIELSGKYKCLESLISGNLTKRVEEDLRRLKFLLEFEGYGGH